MNANTNECKYNTMRMDPVFSKLNFYRQQPNLGIKCRSFDDFSCFATHLCDVLLMQDHSKEDNNNLLRVWNTFSLFNRR